MAKFDVRSTRLAVIPCLGMPIQDECTLLGLLIIYAVILFFFFFFFKIYIKEKLHYTYLTNFSAEQAYGLDVSIVN